MDRDEAMKIFAQLTPEEQAAVVSVLTTNTVRDVGTPYPVYIPLNARCYYRVNSGAFTTIVSFLDAKCSVEALKVAMEDPLQPWYLSRKTLNNAAEAPTVEAITHSQYVEWLRKGGSQ